MKPPPAESKNGLSKAEERIDSPSCAPADVDGDGDEGACGETDARMRAIRASRPDDGGEDDIVMRQGTQTGGDKKFPRLTIAVAADQAPVHQLVSFRISSRAVPTQKIITL